MADNTDITCDPEYINYKCVDRGIKLTSMDLKSFTEDKLQKIHNKIKDLDNIKKLPKCTKGCSNQLPKNAIKSWCQSCKEWKMELEHFIRSNHHVQWEKMNSMDWPDQYDNIAEVFLKPDLINQKNLEDISTITCIWRNCKNIKDDVFKASKPLTDLRNEFTHNYPGQKISDDDKKEIFNKLLAFINDKNISFTVITDPNSLLTKMDDLERGKFDNFISDKTSINAQLAVQSLDINSVKEEVISIKEQTAKQSSDINTVKEEVSSVKEEVSSVKEEVSSVKEDISLVKEEVSSIKEKAAKQSSDINSVTEKVATHSSGIKLLSVLFVIAVVVGVFALLVPWQGKENSPGETQSSRYNHTVNREGCLTESSSEFSMERYLGKKKFVGRQWLFNILESKLLGNDVNTPGKGVVLFAEMGFGKTSLVTQCVCATSSEDGFPLRKHLIAYYICQFDVMLTKSANTFIKRLMTMLGVRTGPCFKDYDNDLCNQDPFGCFDQCLVQPLGKISSHHENISLIIVDALDECYDDDKNIIFKLLKYRADKLPSNFKFLITSRNMSRFRDLDTNFLAIDLTNSDERNKNDIDLLLNYANVQKNKAYITYLDSFFLASKLLETKSIDKVPKSIENFYEQQFEWRFQNKYEEPKVILEIISASLYPMADEDIWFVVSNTSTIMDKSLFLLAFERLEPFVKYVGGNVHLDHQSLSIWLQKKESMQFHIDVTRGHNRLAEYILLLIEHNSSKVDIADLVIHASNMPKHAPVRKNFASLDKFAMKTSDISSQGHPFHRVVERCDCPDALELLLSFYTDIDCENKNGLTTLFVAAALGRTDSFKFFVKHGANVSFRINLYSNVISFANASNISFADQHWGYGILEIASQNGHYEIVKYIIEDKKIPHVHQTKGMSVSAVDVACKMGHIDIIKLLSKTVLNADKLCLYYSSETGNAELVKYLIDNSVNDECITCNKSMYWILGRASRIQGKTIVSDDLFDSDVYTLHDDWRMIACESAMHVAVRTNNLNVVQLLLRHNKSVNCYDRGGRTPLMSAIHYDHREIVQEIIKQTGFDENVRCAGIHELQNQAQLNEIERERLKTYFCEANTTVLHQIAIHNRTWIIDYLEDRHIKLNWNKLDGNGCSSAHRAACHNNIHILKTVLDATHLNTSKCWNGSTPLHTAIACHAVDAYLLLATRERSFEDVNGLLFNVVTTSIQGLFASKAVNSTNISMVFFDHIMKHDADVVAVDGLNRNILHYAIENGHFDVIAYVFKQYKQSAIKMLKSKDKHKKTPLVYSLETLQKLETYFYTRKIHKPSKPKPKKTTIKRMLSPTEYSVFVTFEFIHNNKLITEKEAKRILTLMIEKRRFLLLSICVKHVLDDMRLLGARGIISIYRLLLKEAHVFVSQEFIHYALHIDSILKEFLFDHLDEYINCTSSKEVYCFLHDFALKTRIPRNSELVSQTLEIILNIFFKHIPSELLTEIVDHQGYTLFERAIQGGNHMLLKLLHAKGVKSPVSVKEMIRLAMNSKYEEQHEYDTTAYDDSLLKFKLFNRSDLLDQFMASTIGDYSIKSEMLSKLFSNYDVTSGLPYTGNKERDRTVALLINKFKRFLPKSFVCCEKCANFSLTHLLSIHGLTESLKISSKVWGKDILQCSNVDKITPLYLAKILALNETASFIENTHNVALTFPVREAELNLLFKIRSRFTFDSRILCLFGLGKKARMTSLEVYRCYKKVAKVNMFQNNTALRMLLTRAKWYQIFLSHVNHLRRQHATFMELHGTARNQLMQKTCDILYSSYRKTVAIKEQLCRILESNDQTCTTRHTVPSFNQSASLNICIETFVTYGSKDNVLRILKYRDKTFQQIINTFLCSLIDTSVTHFFLSDIFNDRLRLDNKFFQMDWIWNHSLYKYMDVIQNTRIYKDVFMFGDGFLDAFIDWSKEVTKSNYYVTWSRNAQRYTKSKR